MSQVEMIVQKRDAAQKGALKGLRRNGFVPGIVYHRGESSISVKVPMKNLLKTLHTEAGRNVLIDLKVEGGAKKKRAVVVKDMQIHPVTGTILHIDLHQISLTEKITVDVPIVEKGEPIGVKNEGGVMEFPIRQIQIECLPTEIPGDIEVDISGLGMNEAIHVKDLKISGNVKVLTDLEAVIVHVAPPHVEEEPTPEGEEGQEPEVIGEKKEEGEEGKEGAEAKEGAPAADKEKKEAPKKES